MVEWKHAQITPSGSSQSRVKGQGRRASRHRTCFRWREIIRIGVLRATQNLLRNQRAIRREREKKFKDFEFLKMPPNIAAHWRALAYLTDAIREPWGNKLTDVYHDIWPSQPFRVYICCLEDLLKDFSL
ncbi:hypothetical protein R3W88_000696 [Solanum pinnatisectum]|uniref:Uncharacterized protein n=1 Tax=Solanum pinnatisectum TaxID=50273 RepID=A0AAV9MJ07_9SOLN|nr:hypothetical protein R3W88_000696 [Solanum pinnatisectum]